MAQVLRTHLASLVGDLRPHIITNVSLGKKAGILMKVTLSRRGRQEGGGPLG